MNGPVTQSGVVRSSRDPERHAVDRGIGVGPGHRNGTGRSPETEPTRRPETESTDAPETESTDAPETESTDAPETESTDAADTEGGHSDNLGKLVSEAAKGDSPASFDHRGQYVRTIASQPRQATATAAKTQGPRLALTTRGRNR
jgi:hypothetical protein